MPTLPPSPEGVQTVADLLEAYRDRPVYLECMPGNHGDTLIVRGSEWAMHTHGVRSVRNPAEAELILINGGGSMNEIWPHGFETLRRLGGGFPSTPLAVLPQSYFFGEDRDVPGMFTSRTAPTWLFARERISLGILDGCDLPDHVHVRLDHDMAFRLTEAPLVQRLRASRSSRHILIVERTDPEGTTGLSVIGSSRLSPLRERVPSPLRSVLDGAYLLVARGRARRRAVVAEPPTAFAREALERVHSEHPDLTGLPVYYDDISKLSRCTFAEFGRLIAEAGAVVSTRLHVGILGAMLDKPTYVFRGKYHKIIGIHEYSMADMDHVTLI